MKRVFPLLLAIACAVVFAPSAGAAVPTINSLTHTVVQNPNDAYDISVDWELDQTDGGGATTQVVVFAVRAWNSDCSGAFPGSPSWEYSNFHYISATTTSMSDAIPLPNGVNTYMPLCVGVHAVGMNDVVSASKLDFGPSQWTLSGENYIAPTLIDIGVDVTPNGLPTSYHLNYYKKTAGSPDCLNPTTEELASAQDSTTETITDDLHGEHSVYPEAAGLDPESDYCIALRIGNSARNDDTEFHWLYTTASPIPSVDSESYSGVDGGINFDVDVTPNATLSDTQLSLQYFKKVGGTCTLVMGQESYYNFPSLSPARGTTSANAQGGISGLDPHADYCIRAFAVNGGGGTTPGAFTTVRTVFKSQVTLNYSYIQPSSDPSLNTGFAIGLLDNGAYDDADLPDSTGLDVYRLPASSCDLAGIAGSTPSFSSAPDNWGSGGSAEYDYDFDAGARGTENCIHSHTDSAWGDAYDRDLFVPFKSGVKAAFSAESATKTGDSITLSAELDPGEFASNVTFFSTPLANGESCGAGTPTTVPLAAITTNLSSSHSISHTLTGLADNSRYCVWFMATNDLGQSGSNWLEVKTLDTTKPSVPTAVAISGSQLIWGASTDNDSVAGYNVYRDGVKIASGQAGRVLDFSIGCGQTQHFRVSAVDPSGNESSQSDEVSASGAACPPPPPPVLTKICISPIKTVHLKMRGKHGKKVKVTIKSTVSSDGQTLTVTTKAKGAKVRLTTSGGVRKGPIKGGFTGGPGGIQVELRVAGHSKTVKLKVKTTVC